MFALALLMPALADDALDITVPAAAESSEVAARRPPPPPPRRYYRRPLPPPRRVAVHAAPPAQKTVAELDKDVSITLSPLHLAMGMVELDGEFRASEDVGILLGGGLGTAESGALYDVHAQLRGYALGDFDRGVSLGMEARYGNADLFWVHGPAWAVGPVVGGKYTFDGGFTMEAQVGGQFVNGDGFVAVAPIANFNLGFSF